MAAEITINQPLGAGAGVAGKARNDVWEGKAVELVSTGGFAWLWELTSVPNGSTSVLTGANSSTATVTPDVTGTYRVRLVEDGVTRQTRVFRVRYDSSGVLKNRGWVLPALDEGEDELREESNYGTNTRGWDEPWETILTDIHTLSYRMVVDLFTGTATDSTGVPTVIGAAYLDPSHWHTTRTIKFRCILESTGPTQPGQSAHADLYDTQGKLGTPAVVAGSPVDTSAVASQLVPNMVESDVTAAFASFTSTGVFEMRLWINTASGGNIVACKSAQLVIEW